MHRAFQSRDMLVEAARDSPAVNIFGPNFAEDSAANLPSPPSAQLQCARGNPQAGPAVMSAPKPQPADWIGAHSMTSKSAKMTATPLALLWVLRSYDRRLEIFRVLQDVDLPALISRFSLSSSYPKGAQNCGAQTGKGD